ncbi:MAG TPA: cytochrome P450, partial [Acidobacteriota bacterium]|nr:cytochrome P450 [Acidobacteriota bacterium]
MALLSLPPGPGPISSDDHVALFRQGPLSFLHDLAQQYGDIVYFKRGTENVFLVNNPQYINNVLVTHHRNFTKGRGLQRAKHLVGEGLLTSETELHRRQRRLAQPAFHRERVAGYAAVMVEKAIRMRERWQPNQVVDMSIDMTAITLEIVTQTLFGTNIEAETAQISQACADAMAVIKAMNVVDLRRMIGPNIEDQSEYHAQEVQFEEIKNQLDSVISAIIHQRRQSTIDHGDLLSMLLLAQDVEGDETGMTDEQLRDEIVTLFLAGHETTANALTWTWYLLAQHPEIEAQVHAELDRVLGNRVPSARDYPHLS